MSEQEHEERSDVALTALRGLRMPSGARERILARAERGIRVRRAARRTGVAGAVVTAVAVMLVLVTRPSGDDYVASISDAEGISGSALDGDTLSRGALRVAAGGHVRFRTRGGAQVEAQGPASFELGTEAIAVHEGSTQIEGVLEVDAPMCHVAVDGTSSISIERRGAARPPVVSITVFAGTAERLEPSTACHFEDLTVASARRSPGRERAESAAGLGAPRPRLAPAPSPGTGPGAPSTAPETPAPAATARNARTGAGVRDVGGRTVATAPIEPQVPATTQEQAREPEPAPAPTAEEQELADQVRQYREALALLESDPAAAVARFRSMRIRWPSTTLRQEIDLRIVQSLVRLDRDAEARREANAFLDRHPRSAHAPEMRQIVGSPGN